MDSSPLPRWTEKMEKIILRTIAIHTEEWQFF